MSERSRVATGYAEENSLSSKDGRDAAILALAGLQAAYIMGDRFISSQLSQTVEKIGAITPDMNNEISFIAHELIDGINADRLLSGLPPINPPSEYPVTVEGHWDDVREALLEKNISGFL